MVDKTTQLLLKAFGVMKARSAANKAKNRIERGKRRTKAESRKLDSTFRRVQNVQSKLSPEENIEVITHPDVRRKPLLKPADTARKIVIRNEEKKRQAAWGKKYNILNNPKGTYGKPPIKNPYEHIDASGHRDPFEHAAGVVWQAEDPGSWTPAQQRLMTDAEKGQQRAIARLGEQKLRERRKPTVGEVKRRHTKQGA